MNKLSCTLVFYIILICAVVPLRAFYIDAELGNEAEEVKTAWAQVGAYSSNGGVENYTELSNQNHKLS